MKTLLRWFAKRANNIPARLLVAVLFGMLELYGYKQTGKDMLGAIKLIRQRRKDARNKSL